jgi:hypothetical protein
VPRWPESPKKRRAFEQAIKEPLSALLKREGEFELRFEGDLPDTVLRIKGPGLASRLPCEWEFPLYRGFYWEHGGGDPGHMVGLIIANMDD